MDRLSSERYITAFSKNAAPVLRVSDGATVCIATKDCYMDNLRAENDPRGAAKGPAIGCNPASGPIFVEGAQPGDTLKCEILAIDVGEYASMRISNRGGLMADRVTAPIVRCIPLRDGCAELAGVRMPLDPMIGVIGVAPEGGDVDTESPGAHGGNMDTRHIRAGSTLYLPVAAEGALFALGLWVAVAFTRAIMVYSVPGLKLVKWQLSCQFVPLSLEYSHLLFSVTLMSVPVLVTSSMTGMSP